MKLRSQIDDKYKWDIGFGSQEEIEKSFQDFQYLIDTLPKYNGKFNDKEMFFEYFLDYKKQQSNVSKLFFYISNSLNVDNSDTQMLKLNQKATNMYSKLSKATSFADPQLSKLDIKYLQELSQDPRAKDLTNIIKDIIRNKPHELDESTAKTLSLVNNSFNDSESVFDILRNSEMEFKDATDSKGKTHKMDNASYFNLLSSNDHLLRKSAFSSMMNGYGKLNKTLAELFIKDLKANNDSVLIHNHENLLSMNLFSNEIPKIVFEKNIENVTKNINLLQDFVKTLSKESGIKDFAYYDLFYDEKINGKITLVKGHEIMLSAIAPLGEEYQKKVKYKLSDKSIDYLPNKNKNSGAYCSDLYGAKTLILMNWKDDFNSLSTLCHEMGHCINAEYFNSTQPEEKAGITIFAAEIASTVNEILLNQYMIKNANNKGKKYHLREFLNNTRSTIYRQTLFSEFELFAHTSIEKEIPISYAELNNEYYKLNQKYYGKSCILPKELQYEWSRIPHFYSPYYVYAYSTGLITAINIVSKILEDPDYANQYIRFLKNGTEKPAVEILKEIGIDLTTDEPFNVAFKFIKEQLDIYKSIK